MKKFYKDGDFWVAVFLVVFWGVIIVGIPFVSNLKDGECQCSQTTQEEKIVIDYEALAQIESSNNPKAYNHHSGAIGLFQITHICLSDYNSLTDNNVTVDDLYNPYINYKIASWYLEVKIPEYFKHYKIEDTLEHRLIAYNYGINYLITHSGITDELPKETIKYLEKYKELTND